MESIVGAEVELGAGSPDRTEVVRRVGSLVGFEVEPGEGSSNNNNILNHYKNGTLGLC